MKQEEITADADSVRRQAGLVIGKRHLAVGAVSVRPKPGTGIHRFLNHGGIHQRTVHRMFEFKQPILRDSGTHREKTADLRGLSVVAPPLRRSLGELAAPQAVGDDQQDKENEKGKPPAYAQYYFFHALTSFPLSRITHRPV